MDLSKLPIDIFLKEITYLPFSDVISVCSLDKKLHSYCNNPKYNNHWKALIDNTFGNIYDYRDKLIQVWYKLGLEHNTLDNPRRDHNTYNYLVYTKLVELLDDVTQLMIYYRQGDMNMFNDFNKFSDRKRFLALFLLGEKTELLKHKTNANLPKLIKVLSGEKISLKDINKMMLYMAGNNSVQGVKYFLDKGANIHFDNDRSFHVAIAKGYLDLVKYLVEQGIDVHSRNDRALIWAIRNGHLNIVKFLINEGIKPDTLRNEPLVIASLMGHLDIVKYLLKNGVNVQYRGGVALFSASSEGHLDVVKYLVEQGVDIHSNGGMPTLNIAKEKGHLDIVKYLEDNRK